MSLRIAFESAKKIGLVEVYLLRTAGTKKQAIWVWVYWDPLGAAWHFGIRTSAKSRNNSLSLGGNATCIH
eukprot:5479677-Amphidinium_carterae.1